MIRPTITAILAIYMFAMTSASADVKPTEEELEKTLVATYTAWRNAMLKGDYATWAKHTSSYRRVITRNNIVSQKLRFPNALFEVPMKPAAIDGMKPIQARALGVTSQLVYYGRIDVGVDPPEGQEIPESLLILKFIKEDTQWKFNTLSLLNLSGAKEITDKIKAKDYSFLDKGNFVPPGWVPPTPKECPVPDYVAQIQITSFGYHTEVIINGVSSHRVSDNATSALIIGGLKASPNKVTVTSTPIGKPKGDAEDIPDKVEVSVFAVPNEAGAKPHKSWSYKPAKVPPAYNGIFFAMPR